MNLNFCMESGLCPRQYNFFIYILLVILMSSVHYNAGHIYNAEAGYRMSLQFYTLYLGGILNDNLFVNPFSSDVISPTLHYVLNLMKKRNSLTIAPNICK